MSWGLSWNWISSLTAKEDSSSLDLIHLRWRKWAYGLRNKQTAADDAINSRSLSSITELHSNAHNSTQSDVSCSIISLLRRCLAVESKTSKDFKGFAIMIDVHELSQSCFNSSPYFSFRPHRLSYVSLFIEIAFFLFYLGHHISPHIAFLWSNVTGSKIAPINKIVCSKKRHTSEPNEIKEESSITKKKYCVICFVPHVDVLWMQTVIKVEGVIFFTSFLSPSSLHSLAVIFSHHKRHDETARGEEENKPEEQVRQVWAFEHFWRRSKCDVFHPSALFNKFYFGYLCWMEFTFSMLRASHFCKNI